jgi:F420-dependent oxidoreductase-like protein
MRVSVLFPETRSVRHVISLAERSEALGFHAMHLGGAFGIDPVMALALAGSHTERIVLGTAVVPSWPRHPVVAAQQAATANAACGGRFRFGIGPSHPPVMAMYGIDDARPVGHTREYLTIVRTLLRDGNVSFSGDHYRVQAFLDVEDGGTPPVMLAALHEQMCRTAGALADGAIPWLTPPSYVSDAIIPALQAGAATTGRAVPPIVVQLPCYVSADSAAVHEAARADLAIYVHMPAYAALLATLINVDSASLATTGWTDMLTDAVVPWGDGTAITARLAEYEQAGASEVVLSPYGCGANAPRNFNEALEVLGDIARTHHERNG